jgi:hypothetical protein
MDIMLLDYGAARKIDSSTWGANDFSGHTFKNDDIRTSLERAADSYHNCHTQGSVDIVYGNNNYHMSNVGMSNTDVWYAGWHQADKVNDVFNYQYAHGYSSQVADAASDMELGWDGQLTTKQLVNGDTAQGFPLYYDYGDAAGCPQSGTSGSCGFGYDVSDVGYLSFHGLAVGMPEIYYNGCTVNGSFYPDQANEWTVIRKNWNANNSSSYFFWGITGGPTSAGYCVGPRDAWDELNSKNPNGQVSTNAICIVYGDHKNCY